MIKLNLSTVGLLPGLAALGFVGVWVFSGQNGTFDLMKAPTMNETLTTIPGTDGLPWKRNYFGIRSLDRQLTEILFFFWKVLDGSSAAASLQSFHFFGQAGAYWTIIVLEGLRERNKGRVIAYTTTFGIIFQLFGASIIVPLWSAMYLLTLPSSTAANLSADLSVPVHEIRALVYSILLGYVLPTVAMSIPSPTFVSPITQQILSGLWQLFPLWIYLARLFLRPHFSATSYPVSKSKIYYQLANAHLFALLFAVTTHIFTISLSFSTLMFPSLFSEAIIVELHPVHVFLPKTHNPDFHVTSYYNDAGTSMAEGALRLMQWDAYISATGSLIWAAHLYYTERNIMRNGTMRFDGLGLLDVLIRGVGWSLLAGPAGAAVIFIWYRDQIVFTEDSDQGNKNDGQKGN